MQYPFDRYHTFTNNRMTYNEPAVRYDIPELLKKQSKNEYLTEMEKGVVQAYEARTRKHRMMHKKKRN